MKVARSSALEKSVLVANKHAKIWFIDSEDFDWEEVSWGRRRKMPCSLAGKVGQRLPLMVEMVVVSSYELHFDEDPTWYHQRNASAEHRQRVLLVIH
jgi:hypothetical protein